MKLNQFTRNRNLFSSDPSISQHPILQFKNCYTERLYNREAFRFSQNSCIWWYGCIASLLIFSSLCGMINWYCSLTGVLLCIGSYKLNIKDKLAILLLLDAIIFTYTLLCSDKGNFLEAAGIFFLISISSNHSIRFPYSQAVGFYCTSWYADCYYYEVGSWLLAFSLFIRDVFKLCCRRDTGERS